MTLYPDALRDLIAQKPLQPLGPGQPHAEKRSDLAALALPAAFAPHPIRDPAMAKACLAGLWLAYDFLDESHAISQELHTVEGSYWHAIMHRREPDYSNSKYWFRRVGSHPIFGDLASEAKAIAKEANLSDVRVLLQSTKWDPFAFVDLCEKAANGSTGLRNFCAWIQNREWELLLDYCVRHAIEQE